jgi:hypothetical protein
MAGTSVLLRSCQAFPAHCDSIWAIPSGRFNHRRQALLRGVWSKIVNSSFGFAGIAPVTIARQMWPLGFFCRVRLQIRLKLPRFLRALRLRAAGTLLAEHASNPEVKGKAIGKSALSHPVPDGGANQFDGCDRE